MQHEWGRRGTLIDYWWESQWARDRWEKPIRIWVDNIRMDLGEVGWGDVDCIGLAKDRNRCRAFVISVLNLRVPETAGKLSSSVQPPLSLLVTAIQNRCQT
jgi:hypothetical protein